MGTATWIAGSDQETGQIVLKAQSGRSRVDFASASQSFSEIRVFDSLEPRYQTLAGGKWVTHAIHNSWVDPNWFFPALSTLVAGSQNGVTLASTPDSSHLYARFQIPNQKPAITSEVQNLSTVLYDLDASTRLPTGLHFYTHPDEDLGTNIPVDVLFSDYRAVNGVQVPFHMQRYVNGTLQLEINLSTATLNAGVSDNDFVAN